ncbi:MAG: deoxyribose-phosphate aldolase [Spirochaetales bacterium]|nr:deoxyribose-phosphate aldolase [Spirochaetales bacterium]
MHLTVNEIPRLIDISAVRTDVQVSEIKLVAEIAVKYNFVCAFAMPCFTGMLINELKSYDSIMVGGVIGFPSGADTTRIKVETAKELIALGCSELDMVINVGELLSGNYDAVYRDIKAVVDTAGGLPVKSILEISYLNDDEIKTGSKIAADAGVSFVKTGTGWAGKPTTVNTIELIREAIGDRALIKAAGGVRSLKDLEAMYAAGCSRFGISVTSALKILEEAHKREGLPFNGGIS